VQGDKNLIVWDISTGKEVGQFEWKKGSKEGTKSIKFTEDERFCARLSSRNQIEVYENGNFTESKAKINATAEFLEKKTGKPKTAEEEKSKPKYWFDGFEFIPSHMLQGGSHHQFMFAW
jgi:hypothetical protein